MHRKGTSIAPAEDATFFSSVDRTGEPGFFLRFLDEANKLPDVVASAGGFTDARRTRSEPFYTVSRR